MDSMELEKESLQALKTHQAEYLNTVWKTFAALMLSIGWVISSEQTRNFLTSSLEVRYITIAVVLFMAVMHWLTLVDLQHKSQKISQASISDDNLYQAIGESYEIKKAYIIGSFFINGLLYFLLITIIVNVN
jgi:hypothetical protein